MKKYFALIPLLCLFLIACDEDSVPKGIVATVNGERIALHTLQTLIDCRSASLGIPPRPSLEDMRSNYLNALNVLITHSLVRQELKKRGITIDDNAFDQAIQNIANDYGAENLKKFLDDSYIREDDWRQLIRDNLALETFRNQVLLPGIKIDKQDILNYYEQHKARFALPGMYRLCFVSAAGEKEVLDICSELAGREMDSSLKAPCADIGANALPREWEKEIKGLQENTCSRPRLEGDLWRAIYLRQRSRGGQARIGDVFALIENILLEQRQQDVFDAWLKRAIGEASIRVAPEFNSILEKQKAAAD